MGLHPSIHTKGTLFLDDDAHDCSIVLWGRAWLLIISFVVAMSIDEGDHRIVPGMRPLTHTRERIVIE